MHIISVRQRPDYAKTAIAFFQKHWATEENKMVYEDCITNCLTSSSLLPQWYLLYDRDELIGGAGLIPNDFISRADLSPWLCALFIEEKHRGHAYASLLIRHIQQDASKLGFSHLYLCTDHIGYYEKYGFSYLGDGYHPWGDSSRIYQTSLHS
ncbi:GNAT family N-acetyltransferase [Scatolibacter rhodanostii]|uniref:GNAT family N-acetyltransferase n=1 Tax=Scatolibacter rhodanostii TaxID=2014781 RepID=UPI000C080247|nr:GNAT family N-acetyltransferase [Scatolibacter rhodanostii]